MDDCTCNCVLLWPLISFVAWSKHWRGFEYSQHRFDSEVDLPRMDLDQSWEEGVLVAIPFLGEGIPYHGK